MTMKLNRGPSKEGKRPVTIHLTIAQWEQLCGIAESQCRSATNQALYYVIAGIAGMDRAPDAARGGE